MTVQVTTRLNEDFDVHIKTIDPALSPYVRTVPDYVSRISAFYSALGIHSAMWTTPVSVRPKYLEALKTVEYLLEIDESRIIAYVDEDSWSDFLYDKRESFDYALTATQYESTSILVSTPIRESEVKAIRRYRQTNGPDKYELVEEKML